MLDRITVLLQECGVKSEWKTQNNIQGLILSSTLCDHLFLFGSSFQKGILHKFCQPCVIILPLHKFCWIELNCCFIYLTAISIYIVFQFQLWKIVNQCCTCYFRTLCNYNYLTTITKYEFLFLKLLKLSLALMYFMHVHVYKLIKPISLFCFKSNQEIYKVVVLNM